MRNWKKAVALVLTLALCFSATVLAAGGEKTITVTPMDMAINGQAVTPLKSDGKPAEIFAYDGATYVPLRYLSELLDIEVEWDKNAPNTAKLVNVPGFEAPAAGLKDGTYTGEGTGFGGTVAAEVTVSGGKVTGVKLTGDKETPAIGGAALEKLAEQVKTVGGADIDGVSGATLTSNGVKDAVAAALAQAAGATSAAGNLSFTPGTYSYTTMGMGGSFDVSVTFSQDAITDIKAGENQETLMVGTEAIRILSQRIVENQSLGVDALTGATVTSRALLYAVEKCAQQAGGDVNALKAAPVAVETYEGMPRQADIIIVGGGLAGITAAISAVENGGNVILLEMKDYVGGNSVLSTGTFILGGTSIQAGLGIEDDADTFFNWEMAESDYAKDPNKISMVAKYSQELVDWFASLGVSFNTKKVNSTDGSKINRGHALSPNIGTGVSIMAQAMVNKGVDVRYGTHVDGLITDASGAVTGVTATNAAGKEEKYFGKEIVLACGGFGDNNDMIVEYWGEEYDGLVYGGSVGMDGSMIQAAMALGADTVDMNDAHIDATLEVTRGITITTNLLRNCGGILVRQSTGARFADEQSNHSEIAAAAMHDLGDPYYYEIFGNDAFGYSEAVTTKSKSYVDMSLTTQYDTVEALAAGIGVDVTALKATIDEYNAAQRGDAADPFGRERFGASQLEAPFYVMKVSNGVACTTGGLKTNEKHQVMTKDGGVIGGLYAIGETSGGARVHYVGGDALSNASVGGMLLGRQLAEANR